MAARTFLSITSKGKNWRTGMSALRCLAASASRTLNHEPT
jgi:hypothetical protein